MGRVWHLSTARGVHALGLVYIENLPLCILPNAENCRNMFLAASPYFQHRFNPSPKLLAAFSPAVLSVSTLTGLSSMVLLTHLQSNAHYPRRVILSLILNIVAFVLLALSTVLFKDTSPVSYFVFLMLMVFVTSLATALTQNGLFAYVSGFGIGEYVQGIMTGQAVAGVLPCVAQILSVVSVPTPTSDESTEEMGPVPKESGKSAFAYFLTSTVVSVLALVAFAVLLQRRPYSSPIEGAASAKSLIQRSPGNEGDLEEEDDDGEDASGDTYTKQTSVSIFTLLRKLRFLAAAVFLTFGITMFSPVFTQLINSTHPSPLPRALQPAIFIPLAFLFFNTGDLLGRLLTVIPSIASLTRYPRLIFFSSVARAIWIPLYLLCNIHDRGAIVGTDFFYLVIVQFAFGLTNGLLGSLCMMGAGDWVGEGEREATGGFMGLSLVAGLSVGSLASFGIVS